MSSSVTRLYFTIEPLQTGFDSQHPVQVPPGGTDAIIAQHPEFAYGSFSAQKMQFRVPPR